MRRIKEVFWNVAGWLGKDTNFTNADALLLLAVALTSVWRGF